METVNITKPAIVGISIVMIGYFVFQMYKERNHPSTMPRKRFLLLATMYWVLIALLSLGRWTIFFSWS